VPQIPVNRLGEPEEIARSVVFLAADDAGFITGFDAYRERWAVSRLSKWASLRSVIASTDSSNAEAPSFGERAPHTRCDEGGWLSTDGRHKAVQLGSQITTAGSSSRCIDVFRRS
jgi:hypothetical protein